MLGHASAAMTLDVYSGLFEDDLDAVAERLDEAAVPPMRPKATVTPITQRETGSCGNISGPRGTRTHNQRIKSPLLCQLS
jgi:hypothetical protein